MIKKFPIDVFKAKLRAAHENQSFYFIGTLPFNQNYYLA